jgi:hypothetical protein
MELKNTNTYTLKNTGTTSLERINIAYNKLNGSVPILQNLENLTKVILRDNKFDSVQAQSFSSDHTSLKIVDLSYQRTDVLTLHDHAFTSLPSGTNIILTGNTISMIPPHAFDGLSRASLNLIGLSIRELAPYVVIFLNYFTTFCFQLICHSNYKEYHLENQRSRKHRYAFSGTSNLTIDLRGNYITTVDPTSFPRGAVRGVRAHVSVYGVA